MARLSPFARGVALLCLWPGAALAIDPPPEPVAPPLVEPPDAPPEPVAPVALPPPGVPTSPTADRPPVAQDAVVVRAARLVYDRTSGKLIASGGVVVLARDRALSAPSARLDVGKAELEVDGPVVMADERSVTSCSSATLQLRSNTGELHDVRVEVREPMDAQTREQVAQLGKGRGRRLALAEGERVRVLSQDRLRIDNARVTTCDCHDDDKRPPWAVTASQAHVTGGDYAWVVLPVVRILGVPVMVLPAWGVPLGPRHSGLLFPEFRFQDGFWFAQPVFITLGDSADVTLAPAYVLERGPRMFLEGRAAPAQGSYVEAQLTYQRDAKHLRQRRDPARDAPDDASALRRRINDALALDRTYTSNGERLLPDRFAGRFYARSRFRQASFAADINLVGDRYVPGDFGVSLGERVAPYLRSASAMSIGERDLAMSATVLVFQDLQQPGVRLYGNPSARLAHRMPALQLRMLERPLIAIADRPVVLGRALMALDQEMLLGVGETRERFDAPGRMAGSTRLVIHPEAIVPVSLGRFGGARAGMSVREAVFLGRGAQVADVTRVMAHARADTEITGRMQAAPVGGVVHRIRPYAAYQGVLFARSSVADEWPWLDEADRIRKFHAIGAGLWNEVSAGRVFGRSVGVTTELRGAVDLLDVRQAELLAAGRAWFGESSTGMRVAVDPYGREITFVQANLDVGTPTTPQVHVGYTRVGPRAPRFMLSGSEDVLGGTRFDGPINDASSDRFDIGMGLPVGPLRVDYGGEAALSGLELRASELRNPSRPVRPVLLAHGGGVTYVSTCKCWQASARMRFWPGRTVPDLSFNISLTGPGGEMALMH